jgi:hypothetical protein
MPLIASFFRKCLIANPAVKYWNGKGVFKKIVVAQMVGGRMVQIDVTTKTLNAYAHSYRRNR